MSINPGLLGPYRLLNIINTGQSSRIWQAYHDGEDKFYAVKALLEQFRKSREHVHFLRWEHGVGSKISHDHIIKMHQFGIERGTPYLGMEWFAAPNMKQWIRQGFENFGYMIPKITLQATEALAYFNSLGWVHRDIKPDNFLVTPEGEIKLIDFALARRTSGGLARLFARRERVVQGTRSYMSPEQIRGEALDCRADLYSLACTLFELVGGRPPFTGASANDLLVKHLKAAPPSLQALNHEATPEFSDLLRRALAKKPSSRLNSVDDFYNQLRGISILRNVPTPPRVADEKQS